MGWLTDLTRQADPPVRSLGELARLALAHSTWPGDARIQPRSLASLLSRLDRELELEWLSSRPAVQQTLAAVLGCSVADLQGAAWPGRVAEVDAQRRVRLRDAPFARALDLLEESLPPGVPGVVAAPSGYRRLFWEAPSGSGRTLAGQWLSARALAAVSTRAESAPPDGRPVYLDCSAPIESDEVLAPWARDGVCIAGPRAPRTFVERHGFTVVRTPPLRSFAPALVRWMIARLPSDSILDADRVTEWLLGSGLLHDDEGALGTTIGVCAALDELAESNVTRYTAFELATRFARARLASTRTRTGAETSALERRIGAVLVGLGRRAWVDGAASLSAARSMEAWYELVPEEHRGRVDAEWLRVTLSTGDSPVRPSDIERAARRIPPGAYRIVRALSDARLLVQIAADSWQLRPAWWARAVERAALGELLTGSGFGWGEALLSPHNCAEALAFCCERARRTGEVQAELSEADQPDDPAWVAALEAETRAVGLAIACGRTPDAEAAAALLEEQRGLWLERADALPLPRFAYPEDARAPTANGYFHLALLAISEHVTRELGSRRLRPKGVLDPWSNDSPVAMDALLDSFAAALDCRYRDPELHAGLLALVERLPCVDGPSPHRLRIPGLVLAEAQSRALSWSTLASLCPADGAVLPRLATGHHLPLDALAGAVVSAWRHAAKPNVVGTALDPTLEPGATFVRNLASSDLVELCLAAEAVGAPVLLETLPEPALGDLGRALESLPATLAERWWAVAPDAHAIPLLDAEAPSPAQGAAGAWRRFPARVERALRTWLTTAPSAALPWLQAAPASETGRVVALLERLLALDRFPRAQTGAVLTLLHGILAERTPETRRAHAILARLREHTL